MDIDYIIKQLGGGRRAAEFFSVTEAAVSNWRARGALPQLRWQVLATVKPRLAKQALQRKSPSATGQMKKRG